MTATEALQDLARSKAKAEADAERRKAQLHVELPELAALDGRLAGFGPRIAMAIFHGDQAGIAALKEENLSLQARRRSLLVGHGYSEDEDSPKYSCKKCEDSGFFNKKLCECVRKKLTYAAFAESGLGKGLVGKTFENFSLDYYVGDDRVQMQNVLDVCRKYAEGFDGTARSLLFVGKTGLGKTHLSAAIAGTVAAKGYSVLYEPAQKLFDAYEAARFGRETERSVASYETVDLLMIDDLGAEAGNAYTAATFFNLLNTRLINGMPTLINTNLNHAQLQKNYGERVASRLIGEFRVLLFKGEDVRMQKMKKRI